MLSTSIFLSNACGTWNKGMITVVSHDFELFWPWLSRRADIPVYSFEDHQRQDRTTPMYSPHVLVLEGIFALYDQRILDLLDMKIFTEADPDLCLARRRTFPLNRRVFPIEIFSWYHGHVSDSRCQGKGQGHRRLHQTMDCLCETKFRTLRPAPAEMCR